MHLKYAVFWLPYLYPFCLLYCTFILIQDCNDSNYVRKNVNTYFYCKPNDSYIFNTNDSMNDF
jgi:hypothetical protein